MNYKIEAEGAICKIRPFKLNGFFVNQNDFGVQYDDGRDSAELYSCGNMMFIPTAPKDEVLEKYGIDELEYWSIANALAEKLSFGRCELCLC